jgi:hypothetical protein
MRLPPDSQALTHTSDSNEVSETLPTASCHLRAESPKT